MHCDQSAVVPTAANGSSDLWTRCHFPWVALAISRPLPLRVSLLNSSRETTPFSNPFCIDPKVDQSPCQHCGRFSTSQTTSDKPTNTSPCSSSTGFALRQILKPHSLQRFTKSANGLSWTNTSPLPRLNMSRNASSPCSKRKMTVPGKD